MDEFQSNSHKSKAEAKKPAEKRQLSGSVKIAETRPGFRGVLDELVKADAPTIGRYLWKRVLLPSLKQTTYDMLTNGGRMMLWGNSNSGPNEKRNGSPRERYSYSQCYDYKGDRNNESEPMSYRGRPRYDALVFTNEQDARELLLDMKDVLNQYPSISVLALFDMLQMDCDYTLKNWGWKDLSSADVVPVEDGFWLKLPKARQI